MPLKKNCDCLDSFEIIAQLSKTTVNGRLERPCHTEAGLNRGLPECKGSKRLTAVPCVLLDA